MVGDAGMTRVMVIWYCRGATQQHQLRADLTWQSHVCHQTLSDRHAFLQGRLCGADG